ncbi:MAG: hypothetical protein KIS61_22125 [Candidatus Eremiobacteraeota bacterium]|nr:hypothetical protein [Candidatus Eremiobacteraeota bacterium]
MDYEGGPTSSQDGPLAPLLPDQAKILQLTQEWSQSPEGLLCQLIQLADPGELAFVLSLIGDPLRQRFFALARSLDLQPPASQGLDEIFLLWLRIKKA